MNSIKKEAVPAKPETASKSTSKVSMPQKRTNNKSKRRKGINIFQRVRQIAIKCYEEQIPNKDAFLKAIEDLDGTKYQVLAICHDRDIDTSGIWEKAVEKPHWHIIFRCVNKNTRISIERILATLHIVFRKGLDDNLIQQGGIELVGNFAAYAIYLTHETDNAIKAGKELYSLEEVKSNVSIEGIKQIRDGYTKLSDKRKYTEEEIIQLDKEAYELGHALKDFDEWFYSLPFTIRKRADIRVIKDSYKHGTEVRVRENSEIVRCCIFIQGEPNSGKTYTARKALEAIGIKPDEILVPADGSGKFDKLKATHKAIVIDDMNCPNLLNMTDNRFCNPYKRQSGSPVWTGQYLIITSNKTFADYIDDNHIINRKQIKALETRFFNCALGTDKEGHTTLDMISPSTRGKAAEQEERLRMFNDIRLEFERLIYDYIPSREVIDYSFYEAEYQKKRKEMISKTVKTAAGV